MSPRIRWSRRTSRSSSPRCTGRWNSPPRARLPKGTRPPAVSVRRSITPDYLICLEDGKKFKSLKRHLRTHFNLTPEQYREKWGLPADYPMVAPNYANSRSKLAKNMGLGQKKKKS
jgi:predicted transcriptional regulator